MNSENTEQVIYPDFAQQLHDFQKDSPVYILKMRIEENKETLIEEAKKGNLKISLGKLEDYERDVLVPYLETFVQPTHGKISVERVHENTRACELWYRIK